MLVRLPLNQGAMFLILHPLLNINFLAFWSFTVTLSAQTTRIAPLLKV